AHGALALLLVVGPLIWVAQQQERIVPALTMIPSRIIDGVMSGGGSPTAKAMPAPAPAPAASRPLLVPPAPLPKPETAPPKTESKPAKDEAEAPSKSHKRVKDAILPDKKLAKVDESEES